jgi:hypothetical protein
LKSYCGKIGYETRALAVVALGEYRDQLKRRGHGKDFRKLHVYLCDACPGGTFHLGRSRERRISESEVRILKKPATPKPEAQPPIKKIPSRGQLKRKAKYWDEKLLKDLKHRLYVQGQKIDADARAEKAKAQRDYENALVAIGIIPENAR